MTILINYNLKKKTGVFIFPDNKIVRKFTIYKKKKIVLDKEIEGLKWYFKILEKKNYLNENLIKAKGKNYLDFKLIHSPKNVFWHSIEKNQRVIELAINHYLDVWPRNKKTFFHGDLTVENILLKKNKPIFIDWENSRKKLPWGLDICFLLISALVLPLLNKNKEHLGSSEKRIFKKIWKSFYLNHNFEYLTDPLKFFRKNKLFNKYHFINKIPLSVKKEIIKTIKD